MWCKKPEPQEPPGEQEEQRFRLLNLIANSPLTVSITSPGRVIVYTEFDQSDLEARTGLTIPDEG